MAINWPPLAQGAGTGTTYTAPSPGSNIWTWSGYAWGSKGTTSTGGYGSPWVVFNSEGKAIAYATLPAAIADANVGDTINLFTDTIEYPTAANYAIFDKDLNINLNGNTYTLDIRFNPSINGVSIIGNGFNNVIVRITNGKIKLTNVGDGKNVTLIGEGRFSFSGAPLTGCEWYFSSATFEVNSGIGYVAHLQSQVTGGTFYHSGNGIALHAIPTELGDKNLNIFRNIIAISDNNTAMLIEEGAPNTMNLFINCRGYSYKYSDTENYAGIHFDSFPYTKNRSRLIGCLGTNLAPGTNGITYGIFATAQSSKVIHSVGESQNGGGIYTDRSTLINCTGDGMNNIGGSSFFSLGGSVLRRCISGSNQNIIGLRTIGNFSSGILGDKIENCNFNGTFGIYGPIGSSGNYINIFNTTIRGDNVGVYYDEVNYKVKVINCLVGPKSGNYQSIYGLQYTPIYTGGSGSIIVNNVLEAGGDSHAIRNGTYAPFESIRILISGNTLINTYGIYPSSDLIVQGMTIPISTKNLIDGQPI